jgi:hypothetical protein
MAKTFKTEIGKRKGVYPPSAAPEATRDKEKHG